MTESIEVFEKTLHSRGYSLTATRQKVFAALQGLEPQTMHEIITRCKQVDRASVYRTIALFEQLGIVQRLQIGWKYKLELADSFAHHHHHLTCIKCGCTTALPEDPLLEKRLLILADMQNFRAQDHQLEIRGLCMGCSL